MKTLTLAAAGLLLASCSSISYEDPDRVETLTIDYGSTDLQAFAQSMAESLIADRDLDFVGLDGQGRRYQIVLGDIQNATHQHMDTLAIADSIQTALVQSDKFVVLASDLGQDEIGERVRFEQGSGRVDTTQATAFGRQLGADLVLFGRIISIDKKTGRTLASGGYRKEDVYYKFSFQAVDVETAVIVWMDEKEIVKFESRGIFG